MYIFNWLFAHQRGGTMVLRVDDSDLSRSTDEVRRSILDGLQWLELPWDEEHSQSKRRSIHGEVAEALLAKGAARRDFTEAAKTPEPKDKASRAWLANPAMREMSREESDRRAAGSEPFVLRFRVPRETDRVLSFQDHVFGKHSRKIADIDADVGILILRC